ncbi:MAG: CoB--CoM heterodisulfide reductase iron-sulfur subunit B family protein [Anaerolineae bacterium]
MKYGYYPGCSLERNAAAYHQSAMAVAELLGIDLVEIDDWNCCGATEYFSINLLPAYALVARNLALAQDQGVSDHLVAPCSACFLNLTKTDRYMADSPKLAADVNEALAAGGLHYTPGSVRVRHLLDIIVNDVGYDVVAARVSKPLTGLRVAAYYGCLIVRPGYGGMLDDPEHPTIMDKLLRVLGAEVVDFPLRAQCCGGHMTQISQEVAYEMIRRLLKNAADYEADVIATVCPMCQLNLDAYQANVNQFFRTDYMIPVLYFTQLMGLAFGVSSVDLGIGKEFVDARPALAKIGIAVPSNGTPRRAGTSKEALPMPRLEEE